MIFITSVISSNEWIKLPEQASRLRSCPVPSCAVCPLVGCDRMPKKTAEELPGFGRGVPRVIMRTMLFKIPKCEDENGFVPVKFVDFGLGQLFQLEYAILTAVLGSNEPSATEHERSNVKSETHRHLRVVEMYKACLTFRWFRQFKARKTSCEERFG